MKLIKLLGIEGKKVDIIPTTKGLCLTEIYNKKLEFLGELAFDFRKKWNRFVLVHLDEDMQMSKDCLDEAFELTEKYWRSKSASEFQAQKNIDK